MKKNKKAVLSLKVLIGVLFSIAMIVFTVSIFAKVTRLSDSSKDSFYELIRMIEDANKNSDEKKLESMPLRMDKDTFIVGFTKKEETLIFNNEYVGSTAQGTTIETNKFNKGDYKGCEKDNACICLCRKLKKEYKEWVYFIMCDDKKLICESFDNIDFNKNFLISRHKELRKIGDSEVYGEPLRAVYANKYKDSVAVCEFLNEEKNSCIPVEYLNEDRAFEGMKELAKFIESCKELKIKEEDNYCGCGLFDFDYYIPEGYGVKLTEENKDEDNKGKLKLILRKGKKDTEKEVLVDTKFCQYEISCSKFNCKASPKYNLKEAILDKNLENYDFCQGGSSGNFCDEDYKNQITFVKDKDNNICIVRHDSSSQGKVGLNMEDVNPNLIKILGSPTEIMGMEVGDIDNSLEIPGCLYE